MKKPHVLNRPMFNKGGTSAYGRGIASNLVTEEQRVRYNAGGRVGLWGGSTLWNVGSKAAPKVLPWARQALPKMWKKIKPTGIPKNIVTKQSSTQPIGMRGPMGSRTTTTPRSLWQRAKEFTAENPWWVGGGALAGYNAPTTWEGIKGAGKLGWAGVKGIPHILPDWVYDHDKTLADKNKEVPGKTNKLDAILAAADAEAAAAKAKAEKAAKEAEGAAAKGAKKDLNVIDLTDSERAGLKATLYAGAGAGALDPSNKTVADVLRNTLLGASKAGEKIYDPTTERKYRKYAEAHTNIQDEAFKRKTEWETSDEKLMTERAATLGKRGAEEEKAVGKQVPKTGTGAEYKTIKKSITRSKEKGTPLAGLVVFDTDIQKYMVWDADRKEYIHVPGDIDKVQKVLTELRG